MSNKIIVSISGGEHSGKSSLLALLVGYLNENNIPHTLGFNTDLQNKLDKPTDVLVERVRKADILIMETDL